MSTMTLRTGLVGIVAAAALSASLLTAAPANAATDDTAAIAELRAFQVAAAAEGDPIAQANIRAIDALTAADRAELVDALTEDPAGVTSPSDDATVTETATGTIATDGVSEWITEDTTEPVSLKAARATTVNRSIAAYQTYKVLGVTLTQIKTWGKYTNTSSVVGRVIDWGTQVVKNYQPWTSVSSGKQSVVVNRGNVVFKAKVTVKRGPAPGMGGNWSTYQAYHTVTASAYGQVTSNRWT